MLSKNYVDRKVALLISDPWEFVTKCGTGPFIGEIKDTDKEKALILLKKTISYGGSDYSICVCTPRYQGKIIAEIFEGNKIEVNIMLISTNATTLLDINQQDSSTFQSVVGSIEQA